MSTETSWLFLLLCLWVVVNVWLLARQIKRDRARRHAPRPTGVDRGGAS